MSDIYTYIKYPDKYAVNKETNEIYCIHCNDIIPFDIAINSPKHECQSN